MSMAQEERVDDSAETAQADAAATDPDVDPSVDPAEVERFARLAERWWERNGAFRALHALNPVRIAYVRDALVRDALVRDALVRDALVREARATETPPPGGDAGGAGGGAAALKPLAGLRLLDVGCGGGLMAEPLCRLGAAVVAIDAAEPNVRAARLHASEQGLAIDYRHATAEALAAGGARFDAVLALEIVEHVADLDSFAAACAGLVEPGGSLFVATLNRTLAAYALAIVAAERILGWVPAGSHDWSRFVRPAEMVRLLRRHGLAVADMRGMVYDPLARGWRTSPSLAVNYIVHARKARA